MQHAFVISTLFLRFASSTAFAKPTQICPARFIPSSSPAIKCQSENLKAKQANVKQPIKHDLPDLKIRQYKFTPIGYKHVRVQVTNYSKRAAGPSILQIVVRNINGTAVARRVRVKVPMLKEG